MECSDVFETLNNGITTEIYISCTEINDTMNGPGKGSTDSFSCFFFHFEKKERKITEQLTVRCFVLNERRMKEKRNKIYKKSSIARSLSHFVIIHD